MKNIKIIFRSKQVIVSLIILAIITFAAIFAPIISPGNPLFSVGTQMQAPGGEFIFGTDNTGRDVFAMMIWGSRISIIFAVGAASLSLLIGVTLGAVSGYVGGVIDDILSRIFESFYVIPRIFLIILLVAVFGSSIWLTMMIVGATIWPSNAKIMRGQVLTLKKHDYVEAAVVAGGTVPKILFDHIVPNGIGPVVANSTLQMAQAVLTEAGLSFLGLGDPTKASWGQILNVGQNYIASAPWLVVIPGIAIMLMLLSFNLLGNALNNVLNVKQQNWE